MSDVKPMDLSFEMDGGVARFELDGMVLRNVKGFQIEGEAGGDQVFTVSMVVRNINARSPSQKMDDYKRRMADWTAGHERIVGAGYQPIDNGSGKIPPGDE